MARGVNKAIILGNLGRDPEVRYTTNGTAVCNLAVATSEQWKDRQSGQQQEHTEWHRVVLWARTAEVAGQYLQKGSKVYIEGQLRTRKWQDQSGNDRYSTEIVARDLQMLGGGNGSQGGSQGAANAEQPDKSPDFGGAPADFDDGIPFMRLDPRLY